MLVMPVAAVNDSSKVKNKDKNMIPMKKVEMYADWMTQYFVSTDIEEFDKWEGATTGDPTPIYDLTGDSDPILYDVPVISEDGDVVGIIGIWARKDLGVPVYSLSLNSQKLTTEKAEEITLKNTKEKGIKTGPVNVVYYDFPKRAWEVTLEKNSKVIKRVLVDQATNEVISKDKIKPFNSKIDKEKKKHALKLWEEADKQMSNKMEGKARGSVEYVLDVPLYGQETDVYCSPASAEMILDYHGYDYTQNEIADAMETTESGTPWENIPTGIVNVTGYEFDAGNNWFWDWEDVINEIDNGYPYISNTIGHSRVVRGYHYNTWLFWIKYQRVNDPWPPDEGEIRWENYYTVFEVFITHVHPE